MHVQCFKMFKYNLSSCVENVFLFLLFFCMVVFGIVLAGNLSVEELG